MKKERSFTVVMACAALVLGLTFLGCGNSSKDNGSDSDQVALAQVYIDGCNTIASCIQEYFPGWTPEDEGWLDQCFDNCEDETFV